MQQQLQLQDAVLGRGLRIVVYGVPQPAGSKSHFAIKAGPRGSQHYTGKVGIADGRTAASAQRHKSWRAAVTEAAMEVMGGRPPLDGPLAVSIVYSLPRLPSHFSKRHPGRLLPSAPAFPAVRPDGPKYDRSVHDSLTDAGVYLDDSRIVAWSGSKEYVRVGWLMQDILEIPGCVIRVKLLGA